MKKILQRAAAFFTAAILICLSGLGGVLAIDSVETEEQVDSADVLRAPLVDTAQAENATVMVYMIGSDLESRRGLANDDLNEMMSAEFGETVNVVIQTMGCKRWSNPQIRADTAERFTIEGGELVLQDDTLGQLDSTDPQTLAEFIWYCSESYPSDRNILILWDHGAGPVYGFGYDEYQGPEASLTLDELRDGLAAGGVSFDLIGMDACLMGSLETCCAVWPYADYLVASEDFEPCDGWGYENWLTALGENVNIPSPELGKIIVDSFVEESNEASEDGVLAMIDLRYTGVLAAAWADFAFSNDNALTSANYSWKTTPTSRVNGVLSRGDGFFDMDDYYVTDLLAVASMVNAEGAAPLSSALSSAVAACGATEGDGYMTGLSITLPYGNSAFYQRLVEVFLNCGFSETYLEWLGTFADHLNSDEYYDNWEEWKQEWSSWEDYQEQSDETQWKEWADSHQELLEEVNPQATEQEFGTWYLDNDSGLYYYVFANGDITYQNPNYGLVYYHSAADDSWQVWSMRSWSWENCGDPCYPTDLVNPEQSE